MSSRIVFLRKMSFQRPFHFAINTTSQCSMQLLRYARTFSNLNSSLFHTTSRCFGPIQDRISAKLSNNFKPHHLSIINESYMHNVPKGAETHFRLVIVSNAFDGLNTLKRHRLVNQVLKDDFAQIHAVAIEAYTPDQWTQMDSMSDLRSPNCRGGSKL